MLASSAQSETRVVCKHKHKGRSAPSHLYENSTSINALPSALQLHLYASANLFWVFVDKLHRERGCTSSPSDIQQPNRWGVCVCVVRMMGNYENITCLFTFLNIFFCICYIIDLKLEYLAVSLNYYQKILHIWYKQLCHVYIFFHLSATGSWRLVA